MRRVLPIQLAFLRVMVCRMCLSFLPLCWNLKSRRTKGPDLPSVLAEFHNNRSPGSEVESGL